MRSVLAGILLCLLVPSSAWAGGQLDAVRLSNHQGKTRVVLDVSSEAAPKLMSLRNPSRLVIDLPGFSAASNVQIAKGLGVVSGIRTAPQANGDLRVVLDLNETAKASESRLAPSGGYGHRLLFDLSTSSERTARKTVKEMTGAGRDVVVAIDAGHGGKDPGASGRQGTREKDVVLAIARKLAKRVNDQPGMKAVLTRDGDVFLNLRERMVKARSNGADLFISIHADAVDSSQPRGASVYVVSDRGASNEAARLLAERENASDLRGGVNLGEQEDMVAFALLDMYRGLTETGAVTAGEEVLSELGRIGKLHSSKIQNAGFMVLKSPDVPSILVETAFISNPTDEKNLRSSAHQQKVADAILRGVVDYFNKSPPEGTLLAQAGPQKVRGATGGAQEHVIARGDTLSGIAYRYNVSLRNLRSANGLRNDRIRVGQVLRIPST